MSDWAYALTRYETDVHAAERAIALNRARAERVAAAEAPGAEGESRGGARRPFPGLQRRRGTMRA